MVTFIPPDTGGEPTELRRRRADSAHTPAHTPNATEAVEVSAVRHTSARRAKANGAVPSTTTEEASSPASREDDVEDGERSNLTSENANGHVKRANGHSSDVTDSGEDDPFPDAQGEKVASENESIAQPRFSTLKLPAKYDHLDLETRLWLQSRSTSSRKIDASFDGSKTPRRKLSWATLCLTLDLVCVLAPAGWTLIASNTELLVRLLFYLLGELLEGEFFVSPGCSLLLTRRVNLLH
jgi:hypothetical protein